VQSEGRGRFGGVRTTAGFGQSSPIYNVLNFFFYGVVPKDDQGGKIQNTERRRERREEQNNGKQKGMRDGDHDRKMRQQERS